MDGTIHLISSGGEPPASSSSDTLNKEIIRLYKTEVKFIVPVWGIKLTQEMEFLNGIGIFSRGCWA